VHQKYDTSSLSLSVYLAYSTNAMKYILPVCLLLLASIHLPGQTCNPDSCPNLIVNGDFNSGNTGFTTTLTYNTVGAQPASDHYYIHNDAYAVYGNWCGMSPDSSPFMIVDGSWMMNTIVWEQTIPVITPSAGLDFCFLITNLDVNHTFPQPNMAIQIFDQNGDTLLNFTSGNIPPQNSQIPPVYIWTAVSASFFALATTTSATVTITQLNFNGGGNDFGLEDITLHETGCGMLPVISFSGDEFVCPGTCLNFTNLSLNATSYQWLFPGANPPISTDTDPQNICYNTPGTYDITLIATNANGSDTLVVPGYVTVYNYPPAQGITQHGDTLVSNGGAITYQWYFNGNLIAGATDSFYVAAEGGNYNVVCTDSNGCEVEAVIFDVVAAVTPLSLGEGSGVRLFPNPAHDVILIKSSVSEIQKLKVMNIYGQTVLETVNADRLDISQLASGYYILEAKSSLHLYRTDFLKH